MSVTKMANKYATLSLILAILYVSSYGKVAYSRRVSTITTSVYNIGEPRVMQQPTVHALEEMKLTVPVTCEPKYGFLPCTSALWGSLFLVVVYEYVSYLGERYISMGSELMFKVLGPGIFGASAFQILGSLPEAILVMSTGLYGTKEVAQDQVKFGIWLLCGSTIMLITILWGACIACGCYDLSSPPLTPSSSTDQLLLSAPALASKKKPVSLTGYGVTIDRETNYTAAIMMFSLIPFLVALPQLWGATLGNYPVLVALIFSITFLVSFIFYQVFSPWIQNRRLEYVMGKVLGKVALGKLLSENGVPKTPIIKELFHKIDQNDDGFVTPQEIRGLIIGVQFEEVGLKKDDFLGNVMEEFDNYAGAHIGEDDFIKGISSWLSKTKQSAYKRDRKRRCQLNSNSASSSQVHNATTEEEQQLLVNEPTVPTHVVTHKDIHVFENAVWTFIKAVSLLLLGIGILVLFVDPLIESIQNFSNAANIDPFLFSFVVLPIAMNYREAMSAIKSARHKKEHSASLTFSEIYTAVFMNNIVGISITLVMVYAQGLAWDFAAEVVVVLTVPISVGFIGLRCKTLCLWASILAIFLYFFSLFLLYVLINVFGWA